MKDKDIAEFLPRIGDKVNLKIHQETKNKKRKPKSSPLKALRQKMGINGNDIQGNSSSDEGPSTSTSKSRKRTCLDLGIRVQTKKCVKRKLVGVMRVNK